MTQQEQIHSRILRAVEQDPQISQRELARQLTVSNGKAHYLIAAIDPPGSPQACGPRDDDNPPRPSLRGAQRRGNPELRVWIATGLRPSR